MKRKEFFQKSFTLAGAAAIMPSVFGKSLLDAQKESNTAAEITNKITQIPIPANGNTPAENSPYEGTQISSPKFGVASLEDPASSEWESLRNQLFPINSNLTYLNNGTMGITPYPVLHALNKAFTYTAENGAYPHADGSLEAAIADVLGCDAEEIAITKNVSEGVNLACWGIPLKKGDEVLITKHEHVGGCAAWLHRAKVDGIVLKVVELGSNAEETLKNFQAAATNKTKVIAIPHIPCTIGQVLPVQMICEWAKSAKIVTAIDGAHPAGMLQIDLHKIGCDYYSGCLHKWMLAPIGLGFFYCSKSMLQYTKIQHVAAYSVDKFDMSTNPPTFGELAQKTGRFSYGSFCGPLYEAGKTAIQLYKNIGPDNIQSRVKYLQSKVDSQLREINNSAIDPGLIQILTPTEYASRGAQTAFRIAPATQPSLSQKFCDYARKKGIVLRYVGENNIDCVRVSTHYYNLESEIKSFTAALRGFLKEENLLKTIAE